MYKYLVNFEQITFDGQSDDCLQSVCGVQALCLNINRTEEHLLASWAESIITFSLALVSQGLYVYIYIRPAIIDRGQQRDDIGIIQERAEGVERESGWTHAVLLNTQHKE